MERVGIVLSLSKQCRLSYRCKFTLRGPRPAVAA
jgi:hypothetical protein